MLALITLATWQAVAVLVLVAWLLVCWLGARHWSVKRLVMVRVHYKDGTLKGFITFPRWLDGLYTAVAGNPRTPCFCSYGGPDGNITIDSRVNQITLYHFSSRYWHGDTCLSYQFGQAKVLWDNTHALLVSVLENFGVEDGQPMNPKLLGIVSHQRLDALAMQLTLSNRHRTSELTDNQVAYLQRLRDCLDAATEKKWTRDERLARLNSPLPGTQEYAMELLTTPEGAKKVLACINRNWQPEPAPAEPSVQTRTGGRS